MHLSGGVIQDMRTLAKALHAQPSLTRTQLAALVQGYPGVAFDSLLTLGRIIGIVPMHGAN
jgi:hypothetical protein